MDNITKNHLISTNLIITLTHKNNNGYGQNRMHTIKVEMNSELQMAISKVNNPNEQRKIVFDYIMNNIRGKYITKDGREVAITRKTASKYTHDANETKLRATPELANMIMQSESLGVVEAQHKIFAKFAYYKTIFQVDNQLFM